MTKPVMTIHLPVTALSGVGQALAGRLAELGIHRIFDMLLHLPRDYEDRSRVIAIKDVSHGMSVLVAGVVTWVEKNRTGLSVTLEDATGEITLRFFHTYPSLLTTMMVGAKITVFGEIKVSRYGTQMSHPDYHLTGTKKFESGLLPIYPTIKGINQNKLRQLVRLALTAVQQDGIHGLSETQLKAAGVELTGDLWPALKAVHLPEIHADIFSQTALLAGLKDRTHPACRRIIIEELVAHQVSFLFRRNHIYQYKAPKCDPISPLAKQLVAGLPFELTAAQKRVIDEAVSDMATSRPMLRLIQGDVGAGKTLVAAMTACYALDSGWQVAVMAPTEILAEQHLINFQKWFEPLGIGVGWLAGKQTAKERTAALDAIRKNQVQIVVGTHALFSDMVVFAKLGLVIIDEQHRFGVEQRLRLTNKGVSGGAPHQLAMTATPIPRTLAMSMYGDMDVSIIDELPPKRTPITTVTINRDRRDEVIERIQNNCQAGKQAYWVCPLVEESSALDVQSAQLTYEDLSDRLDIRTGLIHGKMKAADKQAVMQAFKAGDIDLLIATTVIEVGVDVPNASLMVIENAERLGLSQLHQLRGRVGRGSAKSFCVLLYQLPLSPTGIERLNVLKDSTDGFVIAQKDLELRGAGELLGKRQTGDMGYYLADIVRDEALLEAAGDIARQLIKTSDKLPTALAIMNTWLPESKDYVNV